MVGLLVFLIIGSETLNFVPDYTFFKGISGLTYTEVYYKISYHELTYTKDEQLSTTIKFLFWSKNLATHDSLGDSWERTSVIPSLEEARDRDLEIIELTALSLTPGDHEFGFKVIDLGSAREGTFIDTVLVPSFEGDELILSWVELASDIQPDSTQSQFFKNNLKVIPNPGGYYSVTRPILLSLIHI